MATQDIRDFDRRVGRRKSSCPAIASAAARPPILGGMTSSDNRSSSRGFASLDHVRGDLRIARGRRQIVMTEQNLNDPDVGSAFQLGRGSLWRSACNVTRLVKPAAALTADRQAA